MTVGGAPVPPTLLNSQMGALWRSSKIISPVASRVAFSIPMRHTSCLKEVFVELRWLDRCAGEHGVRLAAMVDLVQENVC